MCTYALACLDWKKRRASRGSAAKGRNFHLNEKLFKNIWCRPDAGTGYVRHVVSNTSRCKVKGLSPLQGQVICQVIVTLHTWGDDSLEVNKIVHYKILLHRLLEMGTLRLSFLILLTSECVLSLSSNLSHSLNYIHCCNYLSLTPSPLLVLISLSCISALSLSLCASFFSLVSMFYSFPVLCVLLLISFQLITTLLREEKKTWAAVKVWWASSWWGLYYLVNLWSDFNPCSHDSILLNLLHAFFSQASYFLFFLSMFHTRWCRFRFAFLVHITPLSWKSTQVKILDIHFNTHVQESVKQSWYFNPWYKKINRNVDWRSCLFWRVTAGEVAR